MITVNRGARQTLRVCILHKERVDISHDDSIAIAMRNGKNGKDRDEKKKTEKPGMRRKGTKCPNLPSPSGLEIAAATAAAAIAVPRSRSRASTARSRDPV